MSWTISQNRKLHILHDAEAIRRDMDGGTRCMAADVLTMLLDDDVIVRENK
jgi:hypothetical protein